MKTGLFYIVCLFSFALHAQPTALPLYNEFINGLLKNNPIAKRANNESITGQLQYRAAKGNYDPIAAFSYDQKDLNGSRYFTVINAEIKQPIFTNQYVKVGYDYGTGSRINPEFYTPSQGLPYLGLEAGLLQGLLIDKRRAELLKSKQYINYYNAEQQIQINALLLEASNRYFEWMLSARQIALNNTFMQAANTRLQGVKALALIGERATVDTLEASILYQSRLMELQNAQLDNQKTSNDLGGIIWANDNPSALSTVYRISDSLDLYFNKAKAAVTINLSIPAVNNPIVNKYNALQNVLDIDLRLKREMVKPVLNLKYNLLSTNPADSPPVLSKNNYKWGLDFAFPLLFRNSNNVYKIAKITAINNSLELQNKQNEIQFKIQALQQNISILQQQLDNAQESVNYSRLLLNAETVKFEAGESSLFMLNTRETKLLETEIKLSEYKLKFIKTFLQLIYLKGGLNYYL